MKKWVGIGCFLLSAVNIHAQTQYFEYKIAKFQDFSFPIFKHEDSVTVSKINRLLQLSELELLDGYQRKNIFEKISVNNGGIYGDKVEIKYRLISNTPKILSIKLDQTSCGATSHYWVRYYNFNSQNGDLMQLKDFFTAEGFVKVKKMILQKRTQKFKKELTKLKSGSEDLLYVINYFKTDKLEDYYVKDSNIYVDGENSLHKNDKFFDLDMISKINFSDFKSELNECGKAFFGITTDNISNFYSNSFPQLFEGTIGDSLQIIMLFREESKNSIRGLYAYTKYGSAIDISGMLINSKLTLVEKDKDYNNNGFFNATFDGNLIEGTWKNKNKTKTYTISARRRNSS